MDHLKRIADEFTRQAQTFDKFAELTDEQVATRFGSALGEAGSGNLLDVACGPGVVTAAIAPMAASVVAFDATEPMLEKAKTRCARAGLTNVTFKHGDAENLPFEEALFDGVVTRLAIHHFAHPQRALEEMFRVLRPGGVAVIVDVVSSEVAAESKLQNAIERLRDPSHVRMLPATGLDGGLARAGSRSLNIPPGTSRANSRSGWGSSTIPTAPNRSAPSRGPWPKRATTPAWGSRSRTAGSCSFIAGVCCGPRSLRAAEHGGALQCRRRKSMTLSLKAPGCSQAMACPAS